MIKTLPFITILVIGWTRRKSTQVVQYIGEFDKLHFVGNVSGEY